MSGQYDAKHKGSHRKSRHGRNQPTLREADVENIEDLKLEDLENIDFSNLSSDDDEALETLGSMDDLDSVLPKADKRPTGFFHSNVWTYSVMIVAAACGLFASLVLSADTLKLARNPNKKLDCDVNSVLSCSTVAQSPQAEIVKVAGLSFPNAFFGIAAYSVFVTIAVIGAIGVVVPRWFATCTWLGGLAALGYAYWLSYQSIFVIKALCPWCMFMMVSTTILFMTLSHATVTVQNIPKDNKPLQTYYRLRYDLMVDVVWLLAIAALIVFKEGSALFA